jgi:thiamine biosynthesis lipoprotein ApbE
MAVDVNATATTSVDYYDAIASHLDAADRHRHIHAALAAQRCCVNADCDAAAVQPDGAVAVSTSSTLKRATARVVRGVDDARSCVRVEALAFGTPLLVIVSSDAAASDREAVRRVLDVVEEQLRLAAGRYRVEGYDACDIGHGETSQLERFNEATVAAGPIAVDHEVASAVALAQWAGSVSTGGRFDPTCGAAMRVWKQRLQCDKRQPQAAEVAAALKGIGVQTIAVDTAANTLAKAQHDATALDLGAIAKGQAVDGIVEGLKALLQSPLSSSDTAGAGAAHCGILVEWGGDLRTAGVHPLLGRPWLVGICQPPSLNELYKAWHAGEPLPEPSFRQSMSMPETGAAIAASGDYRQLYKYGYTHIFDAEAMTPLKALAHTVSGATVVCPTCAEADAAATALVLEQSLESAVRCVMRMRRLCPPSAELDAGKPPHGVRLLRYFLSERNHDAFVSDEDDTVIGAGDEQRRAQCDKHLSRDAAVHVVSQERAALSRKPGANPSAGNTAAASAIPQHRFAKSLQIARLMMSARPSQLSVAVTPAHSTAGFGGGQSSRSFHAVLLSSTVLLPRGGGPASANRWVMFNVMRGSALFNHVREPGQRVALHLLRAADAGHATAMRANHSKWASSVTVGTGKAKDAADQGAEPATVLLIEELRFNATVCEVRHVVLAGDHLHVVAELSSLVAGCSGAADGPEQQEPPSPYLLKCLGSLCALPPPIVRDVATSTAASVAVLYASHRSYGRVGFPVRGLTLASEDPPVFSCFAVRSSVTAAFEAIPAAAAAAANKKTAGGKPAVGMDDGELIREAGCTVAFLGGGADSFVAPKLDEVIRSFANRDDEHGPMDPDHEEALVANEFFRFIPFPSFRDAPGLVAKVRCDLDDVAVMSSSVDGGCEFLSLLLRLRPETAEGDQQKEGVTAEWSDFGVKLADAIAAEVRPEEAPSPGDGALPSVLAPLLTYSESAAHVTEFAPVRVS